MTGSTEAAEPLDLLVTLEVSEGRPLERVVDALRAAGLEVTDTFELGPVVAGRAPAGKLAALSRVEGVTAVEQDQPLRAL